MTVSRYSLSLRIRHPRMSAAEIVTRVGREPRFQHGVGEARKTRKGQALPGVYKDTYCSFFMSKGIFSAFEPSLKAAVSELQRIRKELLDITASGGTAEFFIGLFLEGNEGVVLTDSLLKDISELRLSLSLDLYGADDPSSECDEAEISRQGC